MTFTILPWAVCILAGLAIAVPSVTFPINSQVPPVARIGEPFSFEFSPSTFSPSEDLTYTLANPPKWLSIDSKARRIFGTPGEEDVAPGEVVGVPFQLEAKDASGSASMSVTLVVCRRPAPDVVVPLAEQNLDFAPLSQPSSFIMGPDANFAFNLDRNTFSHASSSSLTYYAVMADNSPLPAWITFDPSSLAFSGRTPALEALIRTPQYFSFQLVASDVLGFSGASLPFSLVVGNHAITADDTEIVLNATVGRRLSYSGLVGSIKLDGEDAKAKDVSITTTPGIPNWVILDKKTWEISGTPTKAADSTMFTVTFQDQYSDTLNVTVSIDVTDGLFTGTLPRLNLTSGGRLDFDLQPYISQSPDVRAWIETNPQVSWVEYDDATRMISGDIPYASNDATLTISVYAQSSASGKARSEAMSAFIRGAGSQNTKTASSLETATGTATVPSSTSSSSAQPAEDGDKPYSYKIVLAIVLPILFLAIILVCLWLFCVRRRRQKRSSIDRRDISRPVPGTLKTNVSVDADEAVGGLDASYETDYSANSSQVTLERDGYGQPYNRPGFETPPPSRDGHKQRPDSNGLRLVTRSWSQVPHDTPTPPPRHIRYFSDDSLYTDSPLGSHPTTGRRQHLEVEIPHYSIFSVQDTPESAYPNKPDRATHTPGSSDRSTALEDFMQDYMYSPESRPTSRETGQEPRPPPVAYLGSRQRPPFPRRLFADTIADTRPGTSSIQGHPMSISPPESENGDEFRGSPSGIWSSGLSAQEEDMETRDREQAPEPLMTPNRWPAPPVTPPEQGKTRKTTPTGAHLKMISGMSEVDNWVGVATSRYSKASDWMEAVGGSSRSASMDEPERRTLKSRGTDGRSSGEGDYPVFI